MPHLPTRTVPLLALHILTLACGPEPQEPAAEEPNFTVAPTPSPDQGCFYPS